MFCHFSARNKVNVKIHFLMLRHVPNSHQQLTDTSEQTENSFIELLAEMFGKHVLSALSHSRGKLRTLSATPLCPSCPAGHPGDGCLGSDGLILTKLKRNLVFNLKFFIIPYQEALGAVLGLEISESPVSYPLFNSFNTSQIV